MSDIFKKQQASHAALAQFYRWYQVYEVPFTEQRIANQAAMLADDVEIISQAGTTKGKSGLTERLSVFAGWRNAHHVQRTEVSILPDGMISLEADIVYQNIRPDESRHSYAIHYATLLRPLEGELPVFTKLTLAPTGVIEAFQFDPAYAENRARSFMHYWLFLMETEHGNSEKFKELLCTEFSVESSSGLMIDNFDAFSAWLRSICEPILNSTHFCKNITIAELADQPLRVSADFEWEGLNTMHEKMSAETHHEWILDNDMDERFARMKTMKVSIVRPFVVVP